MDSITTRRQFLCRSAQASALGLIAAGGLPLLCAAEPTKPKIKVGQIGTGHAHASKLEVYRQSPDYEVVGIVEPDEAARTRAASQAAFRDLPWMTEEQLLNVTGLQVVLVETRVRDLLNAAEHCVAAGKHVHLDKPAGESLAQYRRILAAAEKKKRMVQMGYMFRYNPAFVLLRKFLQEGWLGEFFEVHTVMSKVVGNADRRNLAQYPGGIMFELGCHVIDQVIQVLGAPDRVHPYTRHAATDLDDGLVDNMLAVCEYPRALATVKASAQEVDGGSRRHFVACGRFGSFHIQPLDAPNVTISLDRNRGEYRKGKSEVRFGNYPRYVGDAADMAKIIREEKPCDFSYQHDLAVQETVLKASGVAIDG